MSRPRTLVLPDGGRIPLATVRRLIAEQRRPAAEQPALFELRTDARPIGERTAAERYATPSLFSVLDAPTPADPEACLRALWTAQGVDQERQAAMIADITAKAQLGTRIGPFTIPAPKE